MRNYRDLLSIEDEQMLIDRLMERQTLRTIVEWYDSSRLEAMSAGAKSAAEKTAPGAPLPQYDLGGAVDTLLTDPVKRLILKAVPTPLNEHREVNAFPDGHVILFIGEPPRLKTALYRGLNNGGYRICRITSGKKARALKNNHFEADFSSLESVQELRALITQSGSTVGGIVNLVGFNKAASMNSCIDDHLDDAKSLFLLIKVFETDLKQSARIGGGLLVNFSCMDGQFGLERKRSFPVNQAGFVGLLKSVAREWPEVRVKCIDVDPGTGPQMLAAKIWQEISTVDGIVEVGTNHKGRWKIDLQEEALNEESLSLLPLDSKSVILFTGGAYGITAEVAKAVAAKYQPHLVITGRTPLPGEEPSQTRDLRDTQLLREYLIKELRQRDPKITPVAVEQHLQKILKERQIRSNIAEMEEAGARVEYHALDVREGKLFGSLLGDIYARWGRIDGVVHGAGIVEDKLIRDKTLESFSRVYETKVTPAKVLAENLRPDTLKFLVFFSSVSGRFGNVGQADYSAANEVLNKLAICLDREWPARVVSINWGPWEYGLVTDDLRKLYASIGINPIPVAEGVRFFMDELHHNATSTPEVVITRSLREITQPLLRR